MELWYPALTTTSLLALVLWLARKLISTRLVKSVEHEFDAKLAKLGSELREGEEQLRASLRARETEIAALRSGALSAMSGRQAALDKRRLEAVDQLWASVTALGPARFLAATLAVVKIDAASELAQRDPKARQFFETIGLGFDPKSMDHASAAKARPYVSPMIWAVFSAMQAVASHAVIQWHALKSGINPTGLIDDEAIKKLIKSALPHYANYIDTNGSAAFYYTFDALEATLLAEIQKMLAGVESDKASVDQAAEILRHSQEILKQAVAAEGAV
jgi:hypothetical protein